MLKPFLVLLAFLALNPADAAEPKLRYLKLSRVKYAFGSFPGAPGGAGIPVQPTCEIISKRGAMAILEGGITLASDPDRHQRELKRSFEKFMSSSFMKVQVDRIVLARKLANPKISDEAARSVYVLVHDCALDELGVGPAVLTIKSNPKPTVVDGNEIGWLLVLSRSSFTTMTEMFSQELGKIRIPELVLAHELMHGITADLLSRATVKKSMRFKSSQGHDVPYVTDISTSFWEGISEGIEATVHEVFLDTLLYGRTDQVTQIERALLERQKPIRENQYAFSYGMGLPKNGGELMQSEGFIATLVYRVLTQLPYTLKNGSVVQGWPFQAFAQVLHERQPSNTIELVFALASTPNGGAEFKADFLKLSGFATVNKTAELLHSIKIAGAHRLKVARLKLRESPENPTLLDEHKKALEEYELATKLWDQVSAQLEEETRDIAPRLLFQAIL